MHGEDVVLAVIRVEAWPADVALLSLLTEASARYFSSRFDARFKNADWHPP
jgi:hypothetical protein